MTNFDAQRAFRELAQPAHRPVIPDGPTTVADVLTRPLAEFPDREFLVGRGKRVTYAEFDRLADRAAAAFADLGVVAGDRVRGENPPVIAASHPDAARARASAPPELPFY